MGIRFGVKMVTSFDVAKKAGVSQTTVSLVLNNKHKNVGISDSTRKKVLEAVENLGYRIDRKAKALASSKSYNIGVAIYDLSIFKEDYYFMELLAGIMPVIGKYDYHLQICSVSEDDKYPYSKNLYFLKKIYEKSIDGVIIIDQAIITAESIIAANSAGVPTVLIDQVIEGYNFPCVVTDTTTPMIELTTKVIDAGYKSIFTIFRPNELNTWHTGRGKFAGIKTGMELRGMKFDESCFFETVEEGVDPIIKKILATSKPPYAFIATADSVAVLVVKSLQEHGVSIPEEAAVVGFHDDKLGTINNPSITTVAAPLHDIGEAAAELLFNIISGKKTKATSYTFGTDIIYRDSFNPEICLPVGISSELLNNGWRLKP